MVDVDFTTKEMIDIQLHLQNYFLGIKAPKTDKNIIKLMKKIEVMKDTFMEIDEEIAKDL